MHDRSFVPTPGGTAPTVGPPENPRRGLGAFTVPNYRIYFFGQAVSQTGSWLQRIAQSWLVISDLHGTPDQVGLLTAFQFLPIMLLSLYGGVIADRLPKRGLLFVVVLVETVQSIALAVLTLTGTIQLWQVYLLALVLGFASAFELPARQSFIGEIVPREQMQSAVGLNSSLFNSARIIGPGIGGFVLLWGTGWAFVLNALSFVAALVSIAAMRTDQLHVLRRSPRGAAGRQLADGLRYSAKKRELVFPLLLLAFLGTFGYNWGVSLPLLARDALRLDSVGFGSLNSAMGLGAVVGALAVTSRVLPSQRTMLLAAIAFSCALFALAVTGLYAASLIELVGIGLVAVVYQGTTNTLLQLNSAEEYRGRVLSLYSLLFAGTTPIGGALTGYLANFWDIQAALAIEGGICLTASLVALFFYWRRGSEEPRPVGAPAA